MAANTDPIFEKIPVVAGVTILPADTTTKKTVATGATDGTRIDQIAVSSNDTAAVNLAFYINDGSTDLYIGNLNVVAGAGYLTVARLDAILTLAPTLGYLWLPSGYILKANAVATITAAKQVDVVAMGGKYS